MFWYQFGAKLPSLQWHNNVRDGVSNHRHLDCLLNRLFRKTVCSRKHQSSTSLAFVRGIHRWPVDSLHKGPVTRKFFPFDDIIMLLSVNWNYGHRFQWILYQSTIIFFPENVLEIVVCKCGPLCSCPNTWNLVYVAHRTCYINHICFFSSLFVFYSNSTKQRWINFEGTIIWRYTRDAIYRAGSMFAPSQWGTSLQSNAVSHWQDANLESALYIFAKKRSFYNMLRHKEVILCNPFAYVAHQC